MPTRRVLKSVAHNLLDSLLSGPYSLPSGHILVQMERAGRSATVSIVNVDLLNGAIDPATAATPELQNLAAVAAARLRDLLAGAGLSTTCVQAGGLRVERFPVDALELDSQPGDLRAVTVTLKDDLGHDHVFDCPVSWLRFTSAPRAGGARSLPRRGERTETPVTRLLGWLEQFLPRLG